MDWYIYTIDPNYCFDFSVKGLSGLELYDIQGEYMISCIFSVLVMARPLGVTLEGELISEIFAKRGRFKLECEPSMESQVKKS